LKKVTDLIHQRRLHLPTHALTRFATCITLILVSLPPVMAQDTGAEGNSPLIVATKITPPFVFLDTSGNRSGPALDMVETVAADLGRTVE